LFGSHFLAVSLFENVYWETFKICAKGFSAEIASRQEAEE